MTPWPAAQTRTCASVCDNVCDGDDDADGVNDDRDLCPGTPIRAVYNRHGGWGEQRIELECGVPSDYG